jgi:hypothetical protein
MSGWFFAVFSPLSLFLSGSFLVPGFFDFLFLHCACGVWCFTMDDRHFSMSLFHINPGTADVVGTTGNTKLE